MMKSCRDVIHDASNLLDVRPACVVELSVARFAQTKDQTAHGTWPRKHNVHGLVAQKRRAGVLATAEARAWPTLHARGRAVCRRAARRRNLDYADCRSLSKHDHLILKCPKTHEGAQLGLGRDMRHQARLAPAENRNQTNQMPHTNIKQSKSHEYHFPIPLVFRIKTIKIPGKSR